ncbi:MAG: hypothetical protein WAM90_19365, partial [Rhodanobacter sp.]
MTARKLTILFRTVMTGAALCAVTGASAMAASDAMPSDSVNPLVGSSNGGNTFPGATMPFGMLQWSPENTRGKHTHTASPSGYLYEAGRIRGFSLTHLSG